MGWGANRGQQLLPPHKGGCVLKGNSSSGKQGCPTYNTPLRLVHLRTTTTHSPLLLTCTNRDPAADVSAFKSSGGHILIGTPGRLDDILKRLGTACDTKQLEVLVRI